MKARTFLLVSGTFFTAMAGLHLGRILAGWDFVVGGWGAPMWVSGVAVIGSGALAIWAFRLAGED